MPYRYTFLASFLVLALGCQNSSDKAYKALTRQRTADMTPEEQRAALPNEAFSSVYDSNVDQLKEIVEKRPQLLTVINDNGETPLSVAYKEGETVASDIIVNKLAPADYTYQNPSNGEGYIFLAAKAGRANDILKMSQRFYTDALSWDFADLDRPNNDGQYALHVAKDKSVAEALRIQYEVRTKFYSEGNFGMPGDFTHYKDNRGQIYLHTAAHDGRVEVIKWGLQFFCQENYLEKSSYSILQAAGKIYDIFRNLVGTYGSADLGLDDDVLTNVQDNNLQTPLHVAAENHQIEAIYALGTCKCNDYYLEDKDKKDIPLQTFIRKLDPRVAKYDDEIHNVFNFLANQITSMRRQNLVDYINHTNAEKQTALAMAARLADRYFYEKLSEYGNPQVEDNQHQTPQMIGEGPIPPLEELSE